MAPERTITVVACESLLDAHGKFITVSGQVRLAVTGRLNHLEIGDRIQITGLLTRPREPVNPGEFDRRIWLRSEGLKANVIAEFPEAVRRIGMERHLSDRLLALRAAVRHRAEDLMTTHLSARTAPVAQSLLLGNRADLDRDLRRAFAESGTLHVLAISGTNIGMLWVLLLRFLRAVRCPPGWSLVSVLTVLPAYTLISIVPATPFDGVIPQKDFVGFLTVIHFSV